jgi:hypothetical protein
VFIPVQDRRFALHRSPCANGEPATPIHLLLHVPRCAGQTIHRHLSTYTAAGSYYRSKKRKGVSRFILPRYDLNGMPHPHQIKALSGHQIGISIDRLFADRPIRRSILLRDPVSHAVSYYNFRMMRYLSQGLKTYSFDLAYRARPKNFITRFILSNFLEISWPRLLVLSAIEKYALVNQFLSNFWFVGHHTRCGELIEALAPDLGVPRLASFHNTQSEWEDRVHWTSLHVEDLSSRTLSQIRQDNELDQLLWEGWGNVDRDVMDTIQLHEICETSRIKFIANELLRPLYQAQRRLQRLGYASGQAAPAPATFAITTS